MLRASAECAQRLTRITCAREQACRAAPDLAAAGAEVREVDEQLNPWVMAVRQKHRHHRRSTRVCLKVVRHTLQDLNTTRDDRYRGFSVGVRNLSNQFPLLPCVDTAELVTHREPN
jgi:hypothetical protein